MKKTCFVVLILFALTFMWGCKSTDVGAERPLWTDSYTIEQVFPSDTYVTGIGRAEDRGVAQSLADGNLASYFSREISSETSAQQVVSSAEGVKNQEELIRNITVKSEIALSGVKYTEFWFDKKTKQYYSCAFLDRKDAWSKYESTVSQEKEKFDAFLKSADKEADPFKKITILQNAKKEGDAYQKVILFSELLYKKGCEQYSQDRKVISSLDEKICDIAMNINMNVSFEGNGTGSSSASKALVKSLIEKIITDNGYKVSTQNVHYVVAVTLNDGKERKDDVVTAAPEISIVIKNAGSTVMTFSKTTPMQTVFVEAEKLLDSKISKALEKTLTEDFAPQFAKLK